MDIFCILSMIGGLAMFLYGMNTMGEGLSRMAGGKLEGILEKLTSRRILAVFLGAGVTAVIQSSSATTVMVVGFVNSGIMKLTQAVGIIMGANIGTTITSWILSLTGIQGDTLLLQLLKPSSFAPVMAAVGIVLLMTKSGGTRNKDIGSILLGFTVLMFGMETMSSSVSGLADNPSFTGLMTTFSNPLLGMLAGAVLTAVIQSSSASVGILQALCITGAVHYSVAIPIIMGQNIGTCVTSIISAVGASANAKRAAMVHLYFNLIGTLLFMIIFYSLNGFTDFAFLGLSANPAGIAVVHSLFNIGATMVLFPFSDLLVKLAEKTVTDKTSSETVQAAIIDERFLERPAFAMELCRGKVRDMALLVQKAIEEAMSVLTSYDSAKASEVVKMEAMADEYEDFLGNYLVKLSSKNLSEPDSKSLSLMLHSLSDFERISDHAMDVVIASTKIHERKLEFSVDAREELDCLCRAINDICHMTVDSFCQGDVEAATHVEPLEQVIDTLTMRTKENHIIRLQQGKCTPMLGTILEDVLTGLERVSDHCSNVAVEMITIYDNHYSMHEYFNSFTDEEQAAFNEDYEKLIKKYEIKELGVMM